jgi:hypothetical protein|tara:strand:+ start:528 stop:689 length:162 start_codon:yes stop_codon:yes gene_type:complete
MIYDDLTHMRVLEREIDIIKNKYTDHDTGNLRTAVSVLECRVKEIENNIREKI